MNEKIVLLSSPEKCSSKDAGVWFKDGLKMLRVAPGLWSGASLCVMLVMLAGLLAGEILAALFVFLPGGKVLAMAAQMLGIIIASILAQNGLLRLCQQLAIGKKPTMQVFWQLTKTWRFTAFWHLVGFLLLMQLGFKILEWQLFPTPVIEITENNQVIVNQTILLAYTVYAVGMQSVVILLSWALVPLMTDFSQLPFPQAFKLQWYGTLNNFLPLTVLSVYCVMLISAGLMVIGAFATLSSLVGMVVFILALLWFWPLSTAWAFSATRHIFADW
ncbi:hypothetical protein [Suttonella ornithocola]|uniref:Uncharacterized protein n=1 Tax=Suttonella ornithocola TaxID=279832 RepID=A0A380MXP7_9GAMM|nr:hypothetical protein [Suttonella ornithocola]SUO97345.1 Uncharacterised protein [Suttonella ornithocola]